jgi:hypothetical protein
MLICLGVCGCAAYGGAGGNQPPVVVATARDDSHRANRGPGSSSAHPPARSLQPEDVSEVVRRETPVLRACYEREVNSSRPGQDRIKVTWVIDAGGKPSNIRIEETTFPDRAVETCVISAIMSWSFPAPMEPIEVGFPFVFRLE